MNAIEALRHVHDLKRPAILPAEPPGNVEYVIYNDVEGGCYVAAGLNLDIASQGDSPEHALTMLHEAISLYYEEQALLVQEMEPMVR